MDGTYTAILDRIVDGETAVLLLEADGAVIDQFDVEPGRLPDDGQHEGAVFEVRIDEGSLVDAIYRPDETEDRLEAARERFDRLSTRLGDEEGDT